MAVPPTSDASQTTVYRQDQPYAPPGQPLYPLFQAAIGNGPLPQAPQAGMAPAKKIRPILTIAVPDTNQPENELHAPRTAHAPNLAHKREEDTSSNSDSDDETTVKRIRSHNYPHSTT